MIPPAVVAIVVIIVLAVSSIAALLETAMKAILIATTYAVIGLGTFAHDYNQKSYPPAVDDKINSVLRGALWPAYWTGRLAISLDKELTEALTPSPGHDFIIGKWTCSRIGPTAMSCTKDKDAPETFPNSKIEHNSWNGPIQFDGSTSTSTANSGLYGSQTGVFGSNSSPYQMDSSTSASTCMLSGSCPPPQVEHNSSQDAGGRYAPYPPPPQVEHGNKTIYGNPGVNSFMMGTTVECNAPDPITDHTPKPQVEHNTLSGSQPVIPYSCTLNTQDPFNGTCVRR